MTDEKQKSVSEVLEMPKKPGRPPKDKLFPVKLLKNYVPGDKVEVVHEEKHIYAGVGFTGKYWAGSLLKLPLEEARNLVNKGLAIRADRFSDEIEDDAD